MAMSAQGTQDSRLEDALCSSKAGASRVISGHRARKRRIAGERQRARSTRQLAAHWSFLKIHLDHISRRSRRIK